MNPEGSHINNNEHRDDRLPSAIPDPHAAAGSFLVPEGYFESMCRQVADKVRDEKRTGRGLGRPVRIGIWQRAAAVLILVAAAGIAAYLGFRDNKAPERDLASNGFYLQPADLFYLVDEYTLITHILNETVIQTGAPVGAAPSGGGNNVQPDSLTQDEILEYLLELAETDFMLNEL
jgi:hypothetical protein